GAGRAPEACARRGASGARCCTRTRARGGAARRGRALRRAWRTLPRARGRWVWSPAPRAPGRPPPPRASNPWPAPRPARAARTRRPGWNTLRRSEARAWASRRRSGSLGPSPSGLRRIPGSAAPPDGRRPRRPRRVPWSPASPASRRAPGARNPPAHAAPASPRARPPAPAATPAAWRRARPPGGAAARVLEVLVQQPVVRRRGLAQGRRQERGVVPETARELGRVDSLEKGSSLLDASPIERLPGLGEMPLLQGDARLGAHGRRLPEPLVRRGARMRGRGRRRANGGEKERGRGGEAHEARVAAGG